MASERFLELQKKFADAKKTQGSTVDAAFSRITAAIDGMEKVGQDPEILATLREMEQGLKELLPGINASQKTIDHSTQFEWSIDEDGLPGLQAKTALTHLQKKLDIQGAVAGVRVANGRILVNDVVIHVEDGRIYLNDTDVTDPVNQSREGGGYRDAFAKPLVTSPLVKTNWLSRLLRRAVAWLEK